MARQRRTRTEVVGEPTKIVLKGRDHRTLGPDLDAPLNRPTIETPGFGVPKLKRTRRDLMGEFRLQMLSEAKELGRWAATDFEIAEHFGVGINTLQYWKATDPVFDSALRADKETADARVEASLYHKAMGYSFKSEKIFQYEGDVIRVPTVEHVPPDNTAMIFWLKNRQRERWTDQQDFRLTGGIDVNVKTDPRALAMAMLASLRVALEAPVIEHQVEEIGREQT